MAIVVIDGCNKDEREEIRLLREILATLLRIEKLLEPVAVEVPTKVLVAVK